ncbi:retrovirus-related pol polyprotein from transposon TNT 1-94 [Tanacetum coccineum]
MPLVIPAAGGSSSAAAAEIHAPTEEGQEDVAKEDAYLELADPDEGTDMVRKSEEEVVTEQSKKVKKRRLQKQSDALPAKKLRTDHPALASGAGGKTLSGLEQIRPAGSRFPDWEQFFSLRCSSFSGERSSSALAILVDTTAAATTSTGAAATTKLATDVNPYLAGPSHPEESEGSDDSFNSPTTLDPSEAKRWYVPRWSITNDSLLDGGFSCRTLVDRVAPCLFFALRSMDYDQLYTEFNVELELKEKLKVKYAARGRLLEEKYLEILKLKSKLAEKEAEAVEVIRLHDQVLSLSEEKSALTVEVTCTEAGHKITSLASERDRLASEVSSMRAGFQDFKEKIEVQQEQQAQELYNRVAELKAHVMDVSGRLEGEFYPTYLTTLVGRRWLLTHGIQLALLKCLKFPEYQGTLGHALGRAVDFGMQEGLEAGHEHGIAGRSLFAVDAYNPEAAKARYVDAVKAIEDVDFPLVSLLKSKKDVRMDEVLDSFLMDGPLVGLPEAAYLQSCIEQLSVPIHHVGDTTAVGETSLSFALMNVHARAEGAKKHAAALRQLMMDIVSAPLSSQTWQLKKANASLTQELKECKTNLDESSRALGEATSSRDSSLIALQTKQTELEKYTALNDLTIVNQKHDELVKKSLLTRSQFEGQLKEKTKVISDLKVKEGKDIDTMIEMDKQIKFLNEILYKRNQSIQTIHMLAPKCATYHGRSTFANPKYLKKAQSDKPRLYEIPYDTSDPANRFCPDGEETMTLEKESRSKLDKDTVKPYDYTYQNSLYETFKPPSKAYLDQLERAKEVRKTMWRKTFVRTKPNIAKNLAFLPISKSISKSRQLYNEMTNNFNHFRTICQQTWSNHTSSAFPNPTAKTMEVLIKTLLMPLSDKTILDSHCFVHELKREMNDDLEYVNSLEKELDELESEKANFSNIYDLLLEECVSKDVTCSYLHSLSDLNANTELQCLYLHKVKECECLAQKLSKQTESVNKEVHNKLLKSFAKLEKHSISLELALQQCKEQMKNNSVCKENGSNVFRKEREQYHEIQDLKAQMQDKNMVINELKKLILVTKGKSVETQFDKPSVVRQPNAQRIPKPSVLGKPTPFSNSPEMRKCGKCVFNSNHDACVSRYLKDVHARTKKPHEVPISASKPKRKANKSVATPHKKTVASDTTNQKSKSYYKKLYEDTNQEWKWWIAKRCPSGYTWTQKPLRTKKIWMPKIRKDDVSSNISPTIDIIVQLILFIVDSGCTKHMTGNLKLLCNFVEKFLGTVRFGNDQFAPILGYGDLIQGNVTIKRVYYVEGLNHNLFSVGQFCDADLEVAFRKSTCFVRDLQGNDLLTGNRGSDLYTISLQETTSSTPICFMAKASPTQAWLWHRRLSHLNFDYITLLSKKEVVTGLPKLKYVRDQLCSSCEMSKAKRSSFKTKAVPSSKGRLNLLHMDLCGPMRVASINGKKYILVIVDDYSRYTWTLFLRSKDETPEVLKDFLTMIQRNLQAQVITVRTDRGTEFLNKTLHAYFKEEGIEHQTSTPRTPEQNGVSKGYRVYNKRTRLIAEPIHIKFDEIKEMMSDHNSSDLAPQRQEDVSEKTDSSQLGFDFSLNPLLEDYYNPTNGLAEERNMIKQRR